MDETDRLRRLTEQLERLERLSATQADSQAAAEQLAAREFTGKADKGGITATVNGAGSLLTIDISRLSKRRHDGVTLGDAVLVAIRAAEQAAAEAKSALMADVSASLGLGDLFGDVQRLFGPDDGRSATGSR
ncbi:YbaB/EbfC family nucleoid-associated protein [Nonomuraea zeae]|uniref:YbaB/EbfC family nucleoid-associated protein n=1 Tax=Nonomuraea zeae TaxID=1642303 RepID=A0A5S4FW19_9ACTN|nr:YbaB/EbfC family nucleoid-associated protein [Nonomuraea zeae]TMR24832.1 YbaB/EbfC family nucleoid-associated protein [Nonomuraea zeae]